MKIEPYFVDKAEPEYSATYMPGNSSGHFSLYHSQRAILHGLPRRITPVSQTHPPAQFHP
jgi:hypothetical protein